MASQLTRSLIWGNGSDMTDDDKALQVLQGHVKWFDPVKGFGFIVAEASASDILLHANVLRNFGQGSVADGTGITVRVQVTQRGAQAVEVLQIEPPQALMQGVVSPDEGIVATTEEILALPLEPARVKWFDKGKGFGFANVFGRPEDVFIHVEVLRSSGFASLGSGEAVCLRVIEGKRGRMAAQVVAWEAAVRNG